MTVGDDLRLPTAVVVPASQIDGAASVEAFLAAADAEAARGAIFARPALSVKSYGAVGNGSTDDTSAIQAAIAAANGLIPVWIPSGTYMVNAATGLQLTIAGTKLILAPGATLKAVTNSLTTYVIVNITAADCSVTGGTIQGDLTTHTGSTGEWGHGITINGGANRCLIESVTVKHCWGDGIYVGNGMPADVRIVGVVCDSNRRQGLSIVGANRIRVLGGSFINTGSLGSTSPAAGIDVEPNPSSGNNVLEFAIVGAVCASNVGPGIQVTRATAQTTRGMLNGCTTHANTQSGILAAGGAGSLAVTAVGCTTTNNAQDGIQAACLGLVVTGGRSFANTGYGVNATAMIKIQGYDVTFNNKGGVLFGAGSDGSLSTAVIAYNNCLGAATTYYEVDVSATGIVMAGSIAKPASSGNRAINGIKVRAGATGAVFAGCRAFAGTGAAFVDDTGSAVQAPAVS